MIERSAVAHCPRCGYAMQMHELRIPVRPQNHGEDATEMQIWESGCKCGKSRVEPIEKLKR